MTVIFKSKFALVLAAATLATAPAGAAPATGPQEAVLQEIAMTGTLPDQTVGAKTYDERHDGRMTASGERFDIYRLTAASATLPLGSYVEIENPGTGLMAVVRINDRPAADAQDELTLSSAAANRLGLDPAKRAQLRVHYLGAFLADAAPVTQVAQR